MDRTARSFHFTSSLAVRWVVAAMATWLLATTTHASVLVIAPHPDDDILAAAGVIHRAVGYEEVTVVFITNGDVNGIAQGLLRQGEAVTAQVQHLGTTEDDLIFLGYPDGALQTIYDSYTTPSSQYVTSFGQGVTYGNRGLGRMDYHSYRFGSPAAYNRPNIVTDLAAILGTYRPSQIFTPSEFERHTDHATTYRLLRLALDAVHATDATYAPVVNRTIIWTPVKAPWPTLPDPVGNHTLTPYLSQTTFLWQDRASLDVPLSMQDTNLLTNLKYQAIQAHASEFPLYDGFLPKWAHKDEIFWPVRTARRFRQPGSGRVDAQLPMDPARGDAGHAAERHVGTARFRDPGDCIARRFMGFPARRPRRHAGKRSRHGPGACRDALPERRTARHGDCFVAKLEHGPAGLEGGGRHRRRQSRGFNA
jgi:LmbE family N-acetylglucosaminyl deacetylase